MQGKDKATLKLEIKQHKDSVNEKKNLIRQLYKNVKKMCAWMLGIKKNLSVGDVAAVTNVPFPFRMVWRPPHTQATVRF